MTAAVFAVLFVVSTLRLLAFPIVDKPAHADAIVLLGGVSGGEALALRLSRAGYAPWLVESVSSAERCPTDAAAGARVTCFRPNPFSTQGEARAISDMATANGWKKILVIARRAQDTRARVRIGRCYHGDVLVETTNPASTLDWPHEIAYEWAALAKAEVWQRGC